MLNEAKNLRFFTGHQYSLNIKSGCIKSTQITQITQILFVEFQFNKIALFCAFCVICVLKRLLIQPLRTQNTRIRRKKQNWKTCWKKHETDLPGNTGDHLQPDNQREDMKKKQSYIVAVTFSVIIIK